MENKFTNSSHLQCCDKTIATINIIVRSGEDNSVMPGLIFLISSLVKTAKELSA